MAILWVWWMRKRWGQHKWHTNQNSVEAEGSKDPVLPPNDWTLLQKQAVDRTPRQSLRPTVLWFCLQVTNASPWSHPHTFPLMYTHLVFCIDVGKKYFCFSLHVVVFCLDWGFFNWKIGILIAFGEKRGKDGETCFMRLRANLWKSEMKRSGGAWQLPCSGGQTVLVPSVWDYLSHWLIVSVVLISFLNTKFCFTRNSLLSYQHLF